MATSPPSKRPKAIRVGAFGARTVRGPREDGRWYWQYRVFDGRESRALDSGWASATEAAIRVGELGNRSPVEMADQRVRDPGRPQPATVREVLGYWLGHQTMRHDARQLADDTMNNCRVVAKRIVETIGDVAVGAVDQRLVVHMCMQQGRRYEKASVQFSARTLLTAWRWAKAEGLVPEVELELPQFRDPERKARRLATWTEFWTADATMPLSWPWVMLVTMGLTGCRTSEAARMRWSDLQLVQDADKPSTWRIGPHADKRNDGGKHPRILVLRPELVERLIRWRDHVGPVDPEGPVVGVGLHSARFWHRRVDWAATGVGPFTGYDLRRMMSQTLMSQGLDPAVYEAQMGHSQQIALSNYRQRDPLFHAHMLSRIRFEDPPKKGDPT